MTWETFDADWRELPTIHGAVAALRRAPQHAVQRDDGWRLDFYVEQETARWAVDVRKAGRAKILARAIVMPDGRLKPLEGADIWVKRPSLAVAALRYARLPLPLKIFHTSG